MASVRNENELIRRHLATPAVYILALTVVHLVGVPACPFLKGFKPLEVIAKVANGGKVEALNVDLRSTVTRLLDVESGGISPAPYQIHVMSIVKDPDYLVNHLALRLDMLVLISTHRHLLARV